MYAPSHGLFRPGEEERRVSVRYGLLALLAEAPTHGYHLKTAFEHRTGGSWALNKIGRAHV